MGRGGQQPAAALCVRSSRLHSFVLCYYENRNKQHHERRYNDLQLIGEWLPV